MAMNGTGLQMVDTIAESPVWYVFFVPDSPTASLFFTLIRRLLDYGSISISRPTSKLYRAIRGFVEAFALDYFI